MGSPLTIKDNLLLRLKIEHFRAQHRQGLSRQENKLNLTELNTQAQSIYRSTKQ